MTHHDHDFRRRSPDSIERDIGRTRERIAATIDELESRVSLSGIVERALGYARQGGGVASGLGDAVRANPGPYLLTGLGVAWLMVSAQRGTGYYDESRESRFSAADTLEDADRPSLGERVRARASAAREKVAGVKDRVGGGLGGVRERAGGVAGRVGSTARSAASSVSGGVSRAFEEQPLLLGGLAVLVGALLGAALPTTETEDRVMGDARDRALDAVRETGRAVKDQAKQELGRAGESAGAEPGASQGTGIGSAPPQQQAPAQRGPVPGGGTTGRPPGFGSEY